MLITRSDDERLKEEFKRRSVDEDWAAELLDVVYDSLRAALSRAEKAEGELVMTLRNDNALIHSLESRAEKAEGVLDELKEEVSILRIGKIDASLGRISRMQKMTEDELAALPDPCPNCYRTIHDSLKALKERDEARATLCRAREAFRTWISLSPMTTKTMSAEEREQIELMTDALAPILTPCSHEAEARAEEAWEKATCAAERAEWEKAEAEESAIQAEINRKYLGGK